MVARTSADQAFEGCLVVPADPAGIGSPRTLTRTQHVGKGPGPRVLSRGGGFIGLYTQKDIFEDYQGHPVWVSNRLPYPT